MSDNKQPFTQTQMLVEVSDKTGNQARATQDGSGDRLNVCQTRLGTFGLMICVDAFAKDQASDVGECCRLLRGFQYRGR